MGRHDTDTNPNHTFVKAVATSLRRRCGVAGGDRILVATSGGSDSVALLRALAALAARQRWRLSLAVGHVQHHLRGAEAEADAVFVESLASRLGLPFMRADLNLNEPDQDPATKGPKIRNTEARARRHRYRALIAMARTFAGDFIVTGHHADDQLETLLMRILRGTAVRGLRGMAWRRTADGSAMTAADCGSTGRSGGGPLLIRPLLSVTHEQAINYLRELGQTWREDHTNAGVARLRARLRHQVLPILRSIRTDAATKSVALADHMRAVHELLEGEIDRHHERVCRNGSTLTIDRGEGRQMNRAVLAGLLRRLLAEAGVPKDRLGLRTLGPITRAIRDPKGGTRNFDLTHTVRLTMSRDRIQIASTTTS